MGAQDISLHLKGKRTKQQIEKAFKQQQKIDAEYRGHQEGYSGDFQTVNGVDYHLDKVFPNEGAAMEYCLENSEKWENVVAVYYINNFKYSKKTERLAKKVDELNAKIREIETKNLEKLKKKTHVTCKDCKSRLNTQYVRTSCVLCGVKLISSTKTDVLNRKIGELKIEIEEQKRLDEQKAKANSKNVDTLLAGWGAC